MTRLVRVLAALMFTVVAAPAGRAQVTLDVSKITCLQFTTYKIASPQEIALWLSGYYNGKRGNTVIDTEGLKANSNKVIDYCLQHPDTPLMQAVESLFNVSR